MNAYSLSQLDSSQGLDSDFGDDLLVGDDGEVGEFSLDELAHEAADVDGGEEDRGLAAGRSWLDGVPHGMEDQLHGIGVEG